MSLPTRQEINLQDDLDGRAACRNFLGKTLEQAEALFRENLLHYQEDLMWMGPAAFRFYVRAALRYAQSEAAAGDSAIASSLAMIFEFRLEHEAAELVPIAGQLAEICGYFVEHCERFDLEPEIFGDVRARFQKLHQTFFKMSHEQAA